MKNSIFALFQIAPLKLREVQTGNQEYLPLGSAAEARAETLVDGDAEAPGVFHNGDMMLPRGLQTNPFFIQTGIGKQGQTPEAHECRSTHQLVLIQAEFLLAIGEEDFDLPSRTDVFQQALCRSLQIAGGPIARLGQGFLQRPMYDDYLTTVEFAHPRRDYMRVDRFRLLAPQPGKLDVVLG
jgi:hypothetical protein